MSRHHTDDSFLTIVSGLPRSGTSMMMRMLAAGGMPVVTDDTRAPDDDNPAGYFESEHLGVWGPDWTWLDDAQGWAVKLLYRSLYALPDDHHYRVILMRRPTSEVLASFQGWTLRHGTPWRVADFRKLAGASSRQIEDAVKWLRRRSNFSLLEVHYHQILQDPESVVQEVNRFLDGLLDVAAMLQIPDPSLYRVRSGQGCLAEAGG